MQSEDLQEGASSLSVTSVKCEMTYSENTKESSSSSGQNNQQSTPKDFKCSQLSAERIKYEREVEKMVPDSPSPQSLATPDEDLKTEDVVNTESGEDCALKATQDHNSNESIRSWLQRITQMQNEIQRKLSSQQNVSFSEFPSKPNASPTPQSTSRVMKYQDLPYMGEMTLDNSKPRRGRKPKKADICHLIYKNYGTIYPGTPNPRSLMDREVLKKPTGGVDKFRESPFSSETFHRSDVQNRIISSLLEKRLTQESKRNKESTDKFLRKRAGSTTTARDQDEPLNLCIRDLNQLKIRLLRKHDDVYTSDTVLEVKSEPQSDDEVEFVHETPSSQIFPQNREAKLPNATPDLPIAMPDPSKMIENGVVPGGYVYWPNAGVFIHPVALQQQLMYYQKLATNNNYALAGHNSHSKFPSEMAHATENSTSELRKLAPKIRPRKSETSEDAEAPQNTNEQKAKRNAPPSSTEKTTPTKRKRSAIFIPPIPTENQSNPATEVSICKFKFTGGAKPSLQEKKMLSVDSGGNFRYYSGTGDKSMRGYEFFPRETLQQQIGNAQGSSTGAFLQASGEKIYPTPPPDFTGKPGADFMLTPEIPVTAATTSNVGVLSELGPRHRKRKSRKSLQREKLEQTFKEKGFLIQTQQLESAEGATYCKFRQLRKFTRYLFRSWKDYLPGNVTDVIEEERANEEAAEPELENLSALSNSELISRDLRSTI